MVLGYFLQARELQVSNRELANSVETTRLQLGEFRESAIQQARLVETNKAAAQLALEQYLGSLRVDALKISARIEAELKNLPGLTELATLRVQQAFALNGNTNSSQLKHYEETISEFNASSIQLARDFEAIDAVDLPESQRELEITLAAIYRLGVKSDSIVTSLREIISQFEKERELFLQRQLVNSTNAVSRRSSLGSS